MSMTGWYPDPAGDPERYRYWDGASWSEVTTTDPRQPPPSAQSMTVAPRTSSRAGRAALIALLAVALVVGGLLAVRAVTGSGALVPGPRAPTVTSGDDSSPSPTTPTCPLGSAGARSAHPADGRVHGGNLSFQRAVAFAPPAPELRLSFARDVAQQTLQVSSSPPWIAQLAVGRLRATDGFGRGARATAETVARCTIEGAMYLPYEPTRSDLHSESVTVGDRTGWGIEADVAVSTPGLSFPGDHIVVIVVPDGADWGMFFGAVPIGDRDLNRVLDATISDLRIS